MQSDCHSISFPRINYLGVQIETFGKLQFNRLAGGTAVTIKLNSFFFLNIIGLIFESLFFLNLIYVVLLICNS